MRGVTETECARVVEHLRLIFPCKDTQGAIISRFEDGISNDNFCVQYASGEKIAFRMVGLGGAGMVDRSDEHYNTLIASQLGLTPEILYFNDADGVKVTRFIENAQTLHNDTIKEESNIVKITNVLRMLHTSGRRFHKDFNVFTEVLRYEALLDSVNGVMYEDGAEVREHVMGLEDELNKMGMQVVPCHCDTLPENWIVDGRGKMWLLDWEYSGMNDLYWDIAAPFIEAEFTPEQEKCFLSAYFDGSIPPNAERRVLIYKIMMDYLWSIWARVKELDGCDLREYGLMRLRRGLENIKRL